MPKQLIKSNTQKLGVLHRMANLSREAINEEARTVDLSFSSEEPYERFFGDEILGHESGEIRLSRLQDGGPLLFNHDRDAHLGIVEGVSIGSDAVGRSVVRFGTGQLASEKFEDVKAGVLTKVSVGYLVHKMVLSKTEEEHETYRVTDWEPLEISLVTVPADVSVGVGRDAEFSDFETIVDVSTRQAAEIKPIEQPIKVEVKAMPNELTAEEREALERDARREAGEKEVNRVREISALGEQHGQVLSSIKTDAQKAVRDGVSVEDFQRGLLDSLSNASPLDLTPATHIDMSEKEVDQKYSILKAINAHMTGNWKGAGFERECHEQIESKLDRAARGFFVPWNIQTRNMTVAGAGLGMELVGTEHDSGSFIDTLRPNSLLGQLNATILPGLIGNLDIPRATSNSTFAFVAEDTGATLSDVGTGTLSLTPKILAGATSMSRSILKQSAPSVEQMVMMNLAKGAALGMDLAGFEGSGAANNPTGIVNTTGVNVQTVADLVNGYPTWAEAVGFETLVDDDDGLAGTLAYVTRATVRGGMKTSPKDAGSGQFICESNEVNGYPCLTSSQLTAQRMIFGNYEDVILAFWGVLDIMHDTATKAASGGLVLRAFLDGDVGVKHAQSFCIDG